jgi:hypothetical protein
MADQRKSHFQRACTVPCKGKGPYIRSGEIPEFRVYSKVIRFWYDHFLIFKGQVNLQNPKFGPRLTNPRVSITQGQWTCPRLLEKQRGS